ASGGCTRLDAGYSMSECGFSISDFGFWIAGAAVLGDCSCSLSIPPFGSLCTGELIEDPPSLCFGAAREEDEEADSNISLRRRSADLKPKRSSTWWSQALSSAGEERGA